MTGQNVVSVSQGNAEGKEEPRWGRLLALWMLMHAALAGSLWLTGVPQHNLAQAVEDGAGQVERQHQDLGEGEDAIRKAIELQRDTLPFWTAIAAIRDFLVAPLGLGLRALVVAVVVSATAAIAGRPVRFPETMYCCVAWQGVWVLGLAVRTILIVVLHRSSVTTTVLLFLPQESFSAQDWTLLGQLDCFAMLGWLAMAWSMRRSVHVNLLVAIFVCLAVASFEIGASYKVSLLIDTMMRMTR